VLAHADDALGEGLERLVRLHHRRRLRRLGHADALAPNAGGELWVAGDPRPRANNAVEVLIDGAQALPAMAEAFRAARSHVHIAGWHLTPDFAVARSSPSSTVRELLGEAAARAQVRVLLWAGAPVPGYQPNRSGMRAVQQRLVQGTGIHCALDARERPMHCHHEKLIVVDDQVAFVGGIDLTSLAGDRFDTQSHPLRGHLGWHDAATRLEGPVVADAARHFAARWREVTGERLECAQPAPPAGASHVQLLRTVPERIYRFAPRGEFRILAGYLRALGSAERLIYIENQYLWSPEIVALLRDKLRRPPCDRFRLLLVLPARPKGGGDDTRGQLGVLAQADAGGGRLLACSLVARSGAQSGPLYVHAKVTIVDDRWLTVGSANLNEHSLFNDTELNVIACDPALARGTRLRLWAEHLEQPQAELDRDPTELIDTLWKPIASEQLARRRAGAAHTHRLVRLPASSRRSARLLGPLQGLLVDG